MEYSCSEEGLGVLGGWVSVGLGATFCRHGCGCLVVLFVGVLGCCVGWDWLGVYFLFGVWVSLGRLGWGVICV